MAVVAAMSSRMKVFTSRAHPAAKWGQGWCAGAHGSCDRDSLHQHIVPYPCCQELHLHTCAKPLLLTTQLSRGLQVLSSLPSSLLVCSHPSVYTPFFIHPYSQPPLVVGSACAVHVKHKVYEQCTCVLYMCSTLCCQHHIGTECLILHGTGCLAAHTVPASLFCSFLQLITWLWLPTAQCAGHKVSLWLTRWSQMMLWKPAMRLCGLHGCSLCCLGAWKGYRCHLGCSRVGLQVGVFVCRCLA